MSQRPRPMIAEQFRALTGRWPMHDDLERVNCDKVGQVGHFCCGWCERRGIPSFECEYCVTGHSRERLTP